MKNQFLAFLSTFYLMKAVNSGASDRSYDSQIRHYNNLRWNMIKMQANPISLGPHRKLSTSKDRWLTWLVSLILALTLVGYPIFSSFAALLSVDNSTLNYPMVKVLTLLSTQLQGVDSTSH